uniref:Uncharacterized protein TCIL3000_11_14230 n=1 Tax=Trypanosoma congolense (strain IL3000) TaxID=1068625 RepID=G0V2N6_TRYCI|nr:unnamed protein product [Trypanosoma congolense IL3000]
MHGSKSTFEMGFCSVHRRKRARADLVQADDNPGHMRCKSHRECRKRNETEMVICSVHNRRRNISQMKEVRKGIFECFPQFTCRAQLNDSGAPPPAPSSNAQLSAPPYNQATKGSRSQQGAREYQTGPAVGQPWAPTTNRPRNGNTVHSYDWAHADRRTWCAKHGKLTSQCVLIKDCCYVCHGESACLSTTLEPTSELMAKGCKELLCSKHNALRLLEFLERTPDKLGYQCVVGHRCHGTLDNQHEPFSEQRTHSTKDAVSSFFV